jgi:phosphoglycolate phosphatase-like HAD superfamily hydrolase
MKIRYAIVGVDDVLIDTQAASRLAEKAIETPLAKHFGQARAESPRNEFIRAIDILTERLRSPATTSTEAYLTLRSRIDWWQRGLAEAGFEMKEWSRHALVACALDACGLPVTRAVIDEVADCYWESVAEHAKAFPDAISFILQLRTSDVAIHLATGSDGFLTFDDDHRTFTYHPDISVRGKLRRLGGLRELGFSRHDISLGHPVGKPDRAFFSAAVERFSLALGQGIDLPGPWRSATV